MALFRVKNPFVEAFQWFKNGDHPNDESHMIDGPDGVPFLSEGKVVRRFRRPDVPGDSVCNSCNRRASEHGFIDDGLALIPPVCPGDYIANVKGKYTAIKPDALLKEFEPVEEGYVAAPPVIALPQHSG
jgi:hypothetical protein